MTEKADIPRGGQTDSEEMMKTLLLLALSSTVIATVLPSLTANISLGAFVLLAALAHAAGRAPVGCQDECGFHLLTTKV
jgi:hypothetical protein